MLQYQKAIAVRVLTYLRWLASGTLTPAELARRGHPYSEKRPNPSLMYRKNPRFINTRSHRFRDSLTWQLHNDELEFFSTAPYASALISGISGLTIERPIFGETTQRKVQKISNEEIAKASEDVAAFIRKEL